MIITTQQHAQQAMQAMQQIGDAHHGSSSQEVSALQRDLASKNDALAAAHAALLELKANVKSSTTRERRLSTTVSQTKAKLAAAQSQAMNSKERERKLASALAERAIELEEMQSTVIQQKTRVRRMSMVSGVAKTRRRRSSMVQISKAQAVAKMELAAKVNEHDETSRASDAKVVALEGEIKKRRSRERRLSIAVDQGAKRAQEIARKVAEADAVHAAEVAQREAEMEKRLADDTAKEAELAAQLAVTQKKEAALQAQIADEKAAEERLQKQLESFAAVAAEKEAALEAKLAAADEMSAEREAAAQEALAEARAAADALAAQHAAAIEARLATEASHAAEVEAQLETKRKLAATLEVKLATQAMVEAELQEKLDAKAARESELEEQLAANLKLQQEHEAALQEKLDSEAAHATELESRLAAQEAHEAELKAEMEGHSAHEAELQVQLEKEQAHEVELNHQIEEQLKEHERDLAALASAKSTERELRSAIHDIESKHDETEHELLTVQHTLEDKEHRIVELVGKLETLEAEKAGLDTHVSEAITKYDALVAAKTQLDGEHKTLAEEKAAIASELERATAHVATLTEEAKTSASALEEARALLESHRSESEAQIASAATAAAKERDRAVEVAAAEWSSKLKALASEHEEAHHHHKTKSEGAVSALEAEVASLALKLKNASRKSLMMRVASGMMSAARRRRDQLAVAAKLAQAAADAEREREQIRLSVEADHERREKEHAAQIAAAEAERDALLREHEEDERKLAEAKATASASVVAAKMMSKKRERRRSMVKNEKQQAMLRAQADAMREEATMKREELSQEHAALAAAHGAELEQAKTLALAEIEAAHQHEQAKIAETSRAVTAEHERAAALQAQITSLTAANVQLRQSQSSEASSAASAQSDIAALKVAHAAREAELRTALQAAEKSSADAVAMSRAKGVWARPGLKSIVASAKAQGAAVSAALAQQQAAQVPHVVEKIMMDPRIVDERNHLAEQVVQLEAVVVGLTAQIDAVGAGDHPGVAGAQQGNDNEGDSNVLAGIVRTLLDERDSVLPALGGELPPRGAAAGAVAAKQHDAATTLRLAARCAELSAEVDGLKGALELLSGTAGVHVDDAAREAEIAAAAVVASSVAAPDAPFGRVITEQGIALVKARQLLVSAEFERSREASSLIGERDELRSTVLELKRSVALAKSRALSSSKAVGQSSAPSPAATTAPTAPTAGSSAEPTMITVGGVTVAAQSPSAAADYWRDHAIASARAQRDDGVALAVARRERGAAEARAQAYRYALICVGRLHPGIESGALLSFARDQWGALQQHDQQQDHFSSGVAGSGGDGSGGSAGDAATTAAKALEPYAATIAAAADPFGVATPISTSSGSRSSAARPTVETADVAALGRAWLASPETVAALLAEVSAPASQCSDERRSSAAVAMSHHLERLRAAAMTTLALPRDAEQRRWRDWQRQRRSREMMARRLVEVQNECTSQLSHAAQQSAVFLQRHAMAERKLARSAEQWERAATEHASLLSNSESALALANGKAESLTTLLSTARGQISTLRGDGVQMRTRWKEASARCAILEQTLASVQEDAVAADHEVDEDGIIRDTALIEKWSAQLRGATANIATLECTVASLEQNIARATIALDDARRERDASLRVVAAKDHRISETERHVAQLVDEIGAAAQAKLLAETESSAAKDAVAQARADLLTVEAARDAWKVQLAASEARFRAKMATNSAALREQQRELRQQLLQKEVQRTALERRAVDAAVTAIDEAEDTAANCSALIARNAAIGAELEELHVALSHVEGDRDQARDRLAIASSQLHAAQSAAASQAAVRQSNLAGHIASLQQKVMSHVRERRDAKRVALQLEANAARAVEQARVAEAAQAESERAKQAAEIIADSKPMADADALEVRNHHHYCFLFTILYD